MRLSCLGYAASAARESDSMARGVGCGRTRLRPVRVGRAVKRRVRQLLPAPWAVHFRPLARPMRPASERLRREGPAESGSVVSGVAIAVALTEGNDFFAEPVNGA